MRKASFEICFVILVLTLAFCNKQQRTAQDDDAVQLLGTWELREVQAGMTPNTEYPAGNGNRYQFSETAYEQYSAGNLEKSGTYRVVRDTTVQNEVGLVVPAGQFASRIIFDNDLAAAKTFFQIESGKLIILSGFFPTDGGSRRVYERSAITGR